MTCAFCYVEKKGKILLVKHNYGNKTWHMPGGKVEINESSERAALREFKEETGLVGRIEKFYGVIDTPKEDIAYLFKVMILGGILRTDFDREIGAVKYFDINKLPRRLSKYALDRVRYCRSKAHG